MPTELEELVEFLHHGNTQIRQAACEHLLSHSNEPATFKKPQLVPIQDLKLLVKDYPPIAKNAITILINLSGHDAEILENLAGDDVFVETLLKKITDPRDPVANEIAMLLCNLAKSGSLRRLITLNRALPPDATISKSPNTLDQLLDCFVKGSSGSLNPHANFDYLAYLLADLSEQKAGREHMLSRREYDDVVPISKITVFTEHGSDVRRRGVASTIKNVAFEVEKHALLLAGDDEMVKTDEGGEGEVAGVNILPYILLPLVSGAEDNFSDDESALMLPDLQLLAPDKAREPEAEILVTHLETLLLLTSTRPGREKLREVQVYPLVREVHAHVENAHVMEACDRLVQILMRDEAEDGEGQGAERKIEEIKDDNDDDDDGKIEEIF